MINNDEFDSKIFYCWTYGDIRCAIQNMNEGGESVPESDEFIAEVGDYLEGTSDASIGMSWSTIEDGIKHVHGE